MMENLSQNIFMSDQSPDIFFILNSLNAVIERNEGLINSVTSDLVDNDFLNEIKSVASCSNTKIYFGKTLRDLKVVIQDDCGTRNHEIYVQYKASKKLVITTVHLPHSSIQAREYSSLEELIETFRSYVNDLAQYFYELEYMDHSCTVMEPINPSFKEDYRRILLDDRTWLHIEVTPEGLARNIHLIGQSTHWHNKLQSGLLNWDHDKNIVENIMSIFDLSSFPQSTGISAPNEVIDKKIEESPVCPICLCSELPGIGVPQPFCQNVKCGVYHHRSCLYQWLKYAAAVKRSPPFGVANGTCPSCLEPITCRKMDC